MKKYRIDIIIIILLNMLAVAFAIENKHPTIISYTIVPINCAIVIVLSFGLGYVGVRK